MATMPVVWCTDRNSVDDKPTAFTLHGIKLEGNVTEKQVLALQNLVAAAAEGRLILPADGTFVLMDSGISLDGTIIDEQNSSDLKAPSIPQRKVRRIEDEILYEFLCCAKCLNQKSEKCCYKSNEALCESKKTNRCMRKNLLQRYFKESCLPAPEVLPEDPLYGIASKYTKRQQRLQRNTSTIKARSVQSRNKISHRIAHNRFSIQNKLNLKRHEEEPEEAAEEIEVFDKENRAPPQYTVMNTLNCDTKDLISFDEVDAQKVQPDVPANSTEHVDKNNIMDRRNIELDPKSSQLKSLARRVGAATVSPPRSPKSNTSSRKTSFDSTCTNSSLDSGFMDMQNKLENLKREGAAKNKLKEKTYAVNYKEYLTQSKNRRKSYEEFKAMFNAQQLDVEVEVEAEEGPTKTSSFKRFLLELVKNEKQNESEDSINNETSSNEAVVTTRSSILEDQQQKQERRTQQLDNSIEDNNNKKESQMIVYNHNSSNSKPEFENKFAILAAKTPASTSTFKPTNETELHSNATKEAMRKNSNFLSLILNQHEVLAVKEKEKAQLRRKSYEEFKRLVNECDNDMSKVTPNDTHFKRQNSRQRKSYASFLFMRRNLCAEQPDTKPAVEETQLTVANSNSNSRALLNYKRNFKIYDKLVYGTIYDILQRKNDIYQKYDKYMTYGTIYEILHRKTAPTPINAAQTVNIGANFKSHKRKSLSAILERIGKPIELETEVEDEAAVAKTTAVRTYGTIYDILQGDKLNGNQLKATVAQSVGVHKSHTRFTVSKIDESQVQSNAERQPSEQEAASGVEEKKSSEENVIDAKVTKPNKMRRLSNILSYKTNNNANLKEQLEKNLDSEELYTKVIGLKQQKKALEANPIVKSSSLDAISKKVSITPPDSPSPPRPRRSLKQQSKSHVYGKKFSLENSEVLPQLHKRGLKPPLQRRRWSCAAGEEKAHINLLVEKEIETKTVAVNKKGKSRRLSEFTRGEFLNEKL